MAEKIATNDAASMNSLFATEIKKASKTAGEVDTKNEGPTPADAQAFKDHAEYLEVIESVLSEDGRNDFAPNDSAND